MVKINAGGLYHGFNQKKLSTLCFSLFSAWLLSFTFQGQVLYSLVENAGIDGSGLYTLALTANFGGLFISGMFIKRQAAAKMAMITSVVVCIAGSLIFFLPYSILWSISILALAFFAGLVIAGWGYYFKNYTPSNQRLQTAAEVLIFSNILMIFINVVTVRTSAFTGLTIGILCLLGTLLLAFRLEACPNEENTKMLSPVDYSEDIAAIIKPLMFLCLFILIITINSGLMYQVVVPAFAHFPLLTSYYWAMPYIMALVILRHIAARINLAYIFYVALAAIGLSFILFMWLDRSVASYLIINTLMLGSFGICDLFWWSILGNIFDYYHNPAQVLGIGLSMNVLGILAGGTIGNLLRIGAEHQFTILGIAMVVIFTVIVMLPILNSQLTRLLKNHAFLATFAGMEEKEQDKTLGDFKGIAQLTEKEREVVRLLLRGYTYKAIAGDLFISENTMKYHIKNIYQKLNINNKMDLIKLFSDRGK